RPPLPLLFPYTTLFRSRYGRCGSIHRLLVPTSDHLDRADFGAATGTQGRWFLLDLPPSAVDLSHLVGTDNHRRTGLGNKYLGTGVEPIAGSGFGLRLDYAYFHCHYHWCRY